MNYELRLRSNIGGKMKMGKKFGQIRHFPKSQSRSKNMLKPCFGGRRAESLRPGNRFSRCDLTYTDIGRHI